MCTLHVVSVHVHIACGECACAHCMWGVCMCALHVVSVHVYIVCGECDVCIACGECACAHCMW